MTTLALGRAPSAPLFGFGSRGAQGTDSKAVDEALVEIRRARLRAASSPQSAAHAQLLRVAAECSIRNWDGYGAKAISPRAVRHATAFLEALPIWVRAPDVVPEPDGEIAMEWDLGPDRIFSVSISELGQLNYAGRFGGGVERHGVEPFAGVVSSEILGFIKHVLD